MNEIEKEKRIRKEAEELEKQRRTYEILAYVALFIVIILSFIFSFVAEFVELIVIGISAFFVIIAMLVYKYKKRKG